MLQIIECSNDWEYPPNHTFCMAFMLCYERLEECIVDNMSLFYLKRDNSYDDIIFMKEIFEEI